MLLKEMLQSLSRIERWYERPVVKRAKAKELVFWKKLRDRDLFHYIAIELGLAEGKSVPNYCLNNPECKVNSGNVLRIYSALLLCATLSGYQLAKEAVA